MVASIGAAQATKGARKKAIVAMARQMAVDLWRWRTGRASAEELGWIMLEAVRPSRKDLDRLQPHEGNRRKI